jgi:hypothetical protein
MSGKEVNQLPTAFLPAKQSQSGKIAVYGLGALLGAFLITDIAAMVIGMLLALGLCALCMTIMTIVIKTLMPKGPGRE